MPDLKTYYQWLYDAVLARQSWEQDALLAYQFVDGDESAHFGSAAVVSELRKMKRPTNVWNILLPKIELLSGLTYSGKDDIRAFARGLDDDRIADVMSMNLKYILDTENAHGEISDAADDMAISGLGWVELSHRFDYAQRDPLFGDITIKRVHTIDMFRDPASSAYDCQDGRFLFKAVWLPEAVVQEEFTSYEPSADNLNSVMSSSAKQLLEPYLQNSRDKLTRLIYCYYKKPATVYYVANFDNAYYKEVASKQAGEDLINYMRSVESSGLVSTERVAVVSRKMHDVHLAIFAGSTLLEDKKLDTRLYPFVPIWGRKFASSNTPFGLIKPIEAPQQEVNKRMSQALFNLNAVPNAGFFYEANSLSEEAVAELRALGSRPVAVGYRGTMPTRIESPALDEAHVKLSEIARIMVDLVSGIMPELAGQTEGVAVSGVPASAIQARQSGSLLSINRFVRNLVTSKKLIGMQLLKLIQTYHPVSKMIRIAGSEYANVDATDLGIIPFDIAIELTPASPTVRQAQFTQALQLMQVGVPVPPDVLINLADVPYKSAVLQSLRANGVQPAQQPIKEVVNQSVAAGRG